MSEYGDLLDCNDDLDRCKAALVDAIEIIRELKMQPLSYMVLPSETETQWKHYIETDARMKRIVSALEE